MDIAYEELKSYEMINIFEYYDFPMIFISKSPSDKYFFNYYIEELEEGTHVWLISEISNLERLNIIGQRISMIEFLTSLKRNLRLNYMRIVPSQEENYRTYYEFVTESNFDSEIFPEEDFYAEFDYLTQTDLVKVEEEILTVSRFKLILKDLRNSHDITVDLFLDIMSNFKKSMKGMAADIGMDNSNVELKLDSLQPSSFGVYLKTDSDMFQTSEKSLGKIFELIEKIKTNNEEELENLIKNDVYSISTIKSLNELLKDIKQNNYTFEIQSIVERDGSPIEVKFERHSYEKVDAISNILLRTETVREEISITGTLITINTKRNNFAIKSAELEYNGKMSSVLFNQVKFEEISFKVPAEINAILIKEVEHDIHNNDEKVKYILESFTQISTNS